MRNRGLVGQTGQARDTGQRSMARAALAGLLVLTAVAACDGRQSQRAAPVAVGAEPTARDLQARAALAPPPASQPAIEPQSRAASVASPRPADPPEGAAAAARVGPPVHQVVARVAWGATSDTLGRLRGAESNPEAPMAIAGDSAGRLWILDQVQGRVVLLDGAALTRAWKVPLTTPQDLALDRGQILVLDRLTDAAVVALDAATGAQRWRLPVAGAGLQSGSGVSGLFVYRGGVWLEQAHASVWRIGDLDGAASAVRRELPGRPARVGDLGLAAHLAGPGKVVLTAHSLNVPSPEAIPPAWAAEATFSRPALQIRGLDSDPWGRVWLAVNTAVEREDGTLGDEHLEVLRYDVGSSAPWRGVATLEIGPEEQHRTFAVGAEGSLWHLARRDDGAVIERWTP